MRARSRSPGAIGTMSAAPHSPVQAAAAAAAAAVDAAARMQELTASSRAAVAAGRYANSGAAEAALRSCAAAAEHDGIDRLDFDLAFAQVRPCALMCKQAGWLADL